MLLGEGVEIVHDSNAEHPGGHGRFATRGLDREPVSACSRCGRENGSATQLTFDTILETGAELLVLGSGEQRRAFAEAFEPRH